jgi:hypothetical protein
MPGQSTPREANQEVSAITLVAASVSTDSGDLSNPYARGLTVVVDITALGGTTPTLTVTIEGKDPLSGKYYTLLASTALNAVATTVLKVYPTIPAVANASAQAPLPKTYRVRATIGGTTPAVTAKIGACLHL